MLQLQMLQMQRMRQLNAVRADAELGHGKQEWDGHALHAEHAEHAEQVPRGGRERGGEGKGKGPDSGEQDGEGR